MRRHTCNTFACVLLFFPSLVLLRAHAITIVIVTAVVVVVVVVVVAFSDYVLSGPSSLLLGRVLP